MGLGIIGWIVIGIVAGAVIVAAVMLLRRLRGKPAMPAH